MIRFYKARVTIAEHDDSSVHTKPVAPETSHELRKNNYYVEDSPTAFFEQ